MFWDCRALKPCGMDVIAGAVGVGSRGGGGGGGGDGLCRLLRLNE